MLYEYTVRTVVHPWPASPRSELGPCSGHRSPHARGADRLARGSVAAIATRALFRARLTMRSEYTYRRGCSAVRRRARLRGTPT